MFVGVKGRSDTEGRFNIKSVISSSEASEIVLSSRRGHKVEKMINRGGGIRFTIDG